LKSVDKFEENTARKQVQKLILSFLKIIWLDPHVIKIVVPYETCTFPRQQNFSLVKGEGMQMVMHFPIANRALID
jgi:hypothetical protein